MVIAQYVMRVEQTDNRLLVRDSSSKVIVCESPESLWDDSKERKAK